MQICLFSPYIPKHIGGGEKYFLDVARVLVADGHDVFVAIPQLANEYDLQEIADANDIRHKYETFLGESLSGVKFIASPLWTSASFWIKLWWTKQFDAMYFLTDGSLFFSLAKKNILHIQFPFTHSMSGVMNRLKLLNWSIKNTNSAFTKKVIEKQWQTKIGFVHHPMIPQVEQAEKYIPKKEKIILHVGRFFRQLHSKRQDVLVNIFKQLVDQHPKEAKGWKLVLVGSVEDDSYAHEVQQLAHGYPIKVLHQTTREELLKWYQRAMVYWHATGYDVDEQKEPAKTEHFGISTVEAMSYGCVPVVIKKGGQPEAVGHELVELLWTTPEECIAHTLPVMTNSQLQKEWAAQAIKNAAVYSEDKFRNTLRAMING